MQSQTIESSDLGEPWPVLYRKHVEDLKSMNYGSKSNRFHMPSISTKPLPLLGPLLHTWGRIFRSYPRPTENRGGETEHREEPVEASGMSQAQNEQSKNTWELWQLIS